MKTKLLFISFLGILMACHKDADHITGEEIIDPPVIRVTTKLVSQTDTTVAVAQHATQTFAGSSTSYSTFPFLVTRGNLVDRDFELITLTTQDLHQYFQAPSLIENDVNYLHWVLPDVQSFPTSTSRDVTVSINPGFTLTLPKGSIQHTNGTPFAGNYTIRYALLDPATFLADAIPSFMGVDDNRQRQALLMKACFYISAVSEAGEQLQFAPTATIELLSYPLDDHWFFDTSKALWQTNPTSVNESHLALGAAVYYGIGVPAKPVRTQGSLHVNGRLTPHQRMSVSYDGITRTVYTTNKGAWATYLPSGHEISIDIPLPCGEVYSTSFITPGADEFELPLHIETQASVNSVFTGTLRNNQGSKLQEGILLLEGAGSGFLYAAAADFNFHIPICLADSVTIQGLDIATGQSGSRIQWQAADSVQVYSVFACEESKMEYLSLNVAGDSKMYWDLKSSINPQSRLVIEEGSAETDLDLQIAISGMMDRAYLDEELNIRFEDQQLGTEGYSLYCPTSTTGCGFSKFIITHFPKTQSQWIRGYFEGNFWIKTFHPLTAGYKPVRGEFQVYRDF